MKSTTATSLKGIQSAKGSKEEPSPEHAVVNETLMKLVFENNEEILRLNEKIKQLEMEKIKSQRGKGYSEDELEEVLGKAISVIKELRDK